MENKNVPVCVISNQTTLRCTRWSGLEEICHSCVQLILFFPFLFLNLLTRSSPRRTTTRPLPCDVRRDYARVENSSRSLAWRSRTDDRWERSDDATRALVLSELTRHDDRRVPSPLSSERVECHGWRLPLRRLTAKFPAWKFANDPVQRGNTTRGSEYLRVSCTGTGVAPVALKWRKT